MFPEIDYPLYVLPHGGGYVALVDPQATGQEQSLVVHTEQAAAEAFLARFELTGSPAVLRNAREFSWLLQHLRAPVTRVAFDPQPSDHALHARWSVPVRELLDEHLQVDYSPWNYPVYVIAQQEGFVSIQGQASDGRPLTAIALFTQRGKAESYLATAGEAGTLCVLHTMAEARRFLGGLQLKVFAVALDPHIGQGRLSAQHCFDIATLMDKYLIEE